MNSRTPNHRPWFNSRRFAMYLVSLLLLASVACAPVAAQQEEQPASGAVEQDLALVDAEPSPTPEPPSPTATEESLVPAGWSTYTSQRCEVAISYPPEMQVSSGDTYSHTISFNPDDPAAGVNFIYVSVVIEEMQGPEAEIIYNYDPAEADILYNMQVGESKSVREGMQIDEWFTYQRLEDKDLGGFTALAYENLAPWEFPEGTKEIRYYLVSAGCTFLVGGYLDTTGSSGAGAITEDLFQQVVSTVQLMP